MENKNINKPYLYQKGKLNRNYKHGMSNTRLFHIWQNMKKRCHCETYRDYHRYGGRGIKVCDEWRNDFLIFYNWAINNGYKEKLQIDRIDVNGNYSPNNCRWVTFVQQQNNRRNNRWITYNNETHTLAEWAKKVGINRHALGERLNRYGWSFEKAITTPLLHGNYHLK